MTLGDPFNSNVGIHSASATHMNNMDERFLWSLVDVDDAGDLAADRGRRKGGFGSKAADGFMYSEGYGDLAQAVGIEYAGAQLYGRVTVAGVEASEVQSKKIRQVAHEGTAARWIR